MKEATNGSAGRATRSAGVPVWRSRPSTITPTWSGERGRVLEVVRHEQRRDLETGEELLQLESHLDLRVGVESRERLVEQQDLGVARERAGERDALPLAAREAARAARRSRCAIRKRSRYSSAALRRAYSTFWRTVRCGKSA